MQQNPIRGHARELRVVMRAQMGETALLDAISEGNVDVVKELIEARANVNAETSASAAPTRLCPPLRPSSPNCDTYISTTWPRCEMQACHDLSRSQQVGEGQTHQIPPPTQKLWFYVGPRGGVFG